MPESNMALTPMVQRKVAAGVLSAGHARALLSVNDSAEQDALASRIVAEGLSVRAVEEIVTLRGKDPSSRAVASHSPRRRARRNCPNPPGPRADHCRLRLGWVGPGRGAGLAASPFPRPARRTRRACLYATGASRALAGGRPPVLATAGRGVHGVGMLLPR